MFCPLALGYAGTLRPGYAEAQEIPRAAIVQQQVHIMRNEEGAYRVLEALRVEFEGEPPEGFVLPGPLALLSLQDGVTGVLGLGGDLRPDQVVYDPPRVVVVGSVGRVFEVAITYVVPREARAIEFRALVPVEELVLEVDRASVYARPGPSFVQLGVAGSDARPLLLYRVGDLDAGQLLRLDLPSSGTDWRQRASVLIATALAAAAAGVGVWRRGSSAPRG